MLPPVLLLNCYLRDLGQRSACPNPAKNPSANSAIAVALGSYANIPVTNGGLTATTKDHGLTEYWAHRVTYCTAPASHPRLFVWIYRHEGRRLRPELRCHAALCNKESTARRLATTLNARLQQALRGGNCF